MSHSVTTNTTRPPTKDSEMSNSGIKIYMTFPVILKSVQVVVSLICLGIAACDFLENFQVLAIGSSTAVMREIFNPEAIPPLKLLLKPENQHLYSGKDQLICRMLFSGVTTIFLIFSIILLTCFPTSLYFGTIKARIITIVDHLLGFGLHLAVSLGLRARINFVGDTFLNAKKMRIVAIFGVINSVLYLIIAITIMWSFRRNQTDQRKSPITGAALRGVSLQSLSNEKS